MLEPITRLAKSIEGAEKAIQHLKELEEELRELDSPFLTAQAFGVEDIIDPRDTRALLCRFIDLAQARLKMDAGVKMKSGVRP